MKINFLGDSITEGAGADLERRYTRLVADYFGAEECNFGVSATRIAKQRKKTPNPDDDVFMCRAIKMDKAADFTFVFGGTNDYGHGDAPIGEFDSRDDYTFYGAFHNLVAYLKDVFKDKLCFILPLPRYRQDDVYGDGSKEVRAGSLKEYIEAEKRVLDYYGVEYLDLAEVFPEPKTCEGDELTIDGLHPNIKGHRLLADCLIKYLKKDGKIND